MADLLHLNKDHQLSALNHHSLAQQQRQRQVLRLVASDLHHKSNDQRTTVCRRTISMVSPQEVLVDSRMGMDTASLAMESHLKRRLSHRAMIPACTRASSNHNRLNSSLNMDILLNNSSSSSNLLRLRRLLSHLIKLQLRLFHRFKFLNLLNSRINRCNRRLDL